MMKFMKLVGLVVGTLTIAFTALFVISFLGSRFISPYYATLIAVIIFISISVGIPSWFYKKQQNSKTAEELSKEQKQFHYASIFFLIFWIGILFFAMSTNRELAIPKLLRGDIDLPQHLKLAEPCEIQDTTQAAENIVRDVVYQFENFYNTQDVTRLEKCVSQSLVDSGFPGTLPTNFNLIGFYIQKVVLINTDEYVVTVIERRQYYRSGISGGSYPEKWVQTEFVLKQINGRWLITQYNEQKGSL